jgi:hypothetical protein
MPPRGTTCASLLTPALLQPTDAQPSSRVFSQFLGFLFTGLAIGPTLGSLITRATQNAIFVFYFATAIHVLYALTVSLAIPESLLPTQRRAARTRHAVRDAALRAKGGWTLPLSRVTSIVAPLLVFVPPKIQQKGTARVRRDWSLTVLAMGFMPETFLLGSYAVTFQFAAATYGWSTEMVRLICFGLFGAEHAKLSGSQLGYWLSIVGVSRAVFLAIILPGAWCAVLPRRDCR